VLPIVRELEAADAAAGREPVTAGT